ncbi:unnamed protein product [Caenorhabditis angaria]|uniref:F-box domain-containing protein n=1 Tax=Caenorhabditis angaria TaxID=860376 RepID=A0A9P1I807_9PELO|nr:unnamed protein product [Caenorhabditis angaria]
MECDENSKHFDWSKLPENVKIAIFDHLNIRSKIHMLFLSAETFNQLISLIFRSKNGGKMQLSSLYFFQSTFYIDLSVILSHTWDLKLRITKKSVNSVDVSFSKVKLLPKYWMTEQKHVEQWRTVLKGQCCDVAFEYYLKFIEFAEDLSVLWIDSKYFPFDKTNIKHLKSLNDIEVNGYSKDLVKCGFMDVSQLFEVKKRVKIHGIYLKPEEISRLKAGKIYLSSPKYSSKDVNFYLNLLLLAKENRVGWKILELENPEEFDDVSSCFGDLPIIENYVTHFKYLETFNELLEVCVKPNTFWIRKGKQNYL